MFGPEQAGMGWLEPLRAHQGQVSLSTKAWCKLIMKEEMAQVVTWGISIDIRKSPGCNWVICLFPILVVISSFAFVSA